MVQINLLVPYSPGMTYGIGFDSLTGNVRGYPLRRQDAEPIPGTGGQTIRYYLNKVESVEELNTQLGLSAEVNAQFGLFGASAKFDFAKSSAFNSYSVFLVARVEVTNAFKQLIDPAFDPPAFTLLETETGKKQFDDQFGDSYISGMQTGGEFCAVLELRTTSQSDQQSVSASLQGSYGVGAEAQVTFTQSMQRATRDRFLKVSMYQAGGTGTEVTNSIEDVLAKVRTFAAGVQVQPVPYAAKIIDYTTLDHPPQATWVDLETARTVLLRYANARETLLALLNDIDYIRRNPEQFVDPDIGELNTAASDIAERLNKLTDNARTAVNDPKEATYLDVGLPEITLPERNPGALITVVSLVGLRGITVKTVIDAPTRPYGEYLAWCDEHYEPGTRWVKPTPQQYEFLTSGINIDDADSLAVGGGFMRWVVAQSPDRGTMQVGDTVTLTMRVTTFSIPPEVRHLWDR